MGDMSDVAGSPPVRMLIINPNTTVSMTDALKPMIDALGYQGIEYTYFTCPHPGFPSINSPTDAAQSASISLPHLLPLLPHHDAFLVACYSQHPLVPLLMSECTGLASTTTPENTNPRKYVTGIFEASITTSLSLINDHESFGIVSTGKVWEEALESAAHEFLGAEKSRRFAACETTGLNAVELHDLPGEEVRAKMMAATRRLLRRGNELEVKSICLGCAGMVGLDDAVRTACVEELGEVGGAQVRIVDGVKAGVGMLYGLARGAF